MFSINDLRQALYDWATTRSMEQPELFYEDPVNGGLVRASIIVRDAHLGVYTTP